MDVIRCQDIGINRDLSYLHLFHYRENKQATQLLDSAALEAPAFNSRKKQVTCRKEHIYKT